MTASDDALSLLDDYLSAAMLETHAAAFEEALFAEAAAGRAPELGYLDAFFAHAQWFKLRGGFSSGATAQEIAALRQLPGVHHIDVGALTRVGAWPADTKYVVYRLDVDLRGYEHIDVALVTPDGEPRKWFRDLAYDPDDGALYGACDAPLAASVFRHEPLIARVHACRRRASDAEREGEGEAEREARHTEIVAELSITPQ